MSRIWLSPPDVTPADRERLLAAFDSGWVAPAGPDLDAFEAEIAAACGRSFAVGLSSGTAALHLAMLELGVGPADEVMVSTLTFAASANAVAYVGATPVFIDAEKETWQVSPRLLEEELESRQRQGRRMPAAAVLVDLYGQCADYDQICGVLGSYGVPLVGDAAEALGATYRGRPAGSFGEAAVVSFNGNKIITTSGGGMLLTDSAQIAERARYLSTQARQPVPHYEHIDIGYNYRLSNLLAALGRSQLADLSRRVARRKEIRQRYEAALGTLPGVSFMPVADYGEPNYWLTCITLDPAIQPAPEEVRLALERRDIETRPTWKPMHMQPVFDSAPARTDGTAEAIFRCGLCIPSGSGLTEEEQDRVIESLLEILAVE